jgi:hypothetical protein
VGTSKKAASKILGLLTAEQAERLLFDWANLKRQDAPHFMKHYRNLLADVSKSLFSYQALLRKAWAAPNSRDRSWYVFMLRHSYAFEMRRQAMAHSDQQLTNPNLPPEQIALLTEMLSAPPDISPLEAALYYLQENVGELAKQCRNVGCKNPYFIADKPWQKYCSPDCAAPATREAKRKWWHARGKE